MFYRFKYRLVFSLKVLVSGGAGFIGSHLAENLAERGFEVIIVDDLSTGSLENIRGLIDSGMVEFHSIDVSRLADAEDLFRGLDAVIHLAALISVEESLHKPLLYHRVNVDGTLRLLHYASKFNVSRFIFASSAAVYGAPQSLPISETHPLNPLSIYASTKIESEFLVKSYANLYGFGWVILRLFNVYGPRQRFNGYSGVIRIFLERALRGEPLIIYGDGSQTRDFIYVEDVVSAFISALNRNVSGVFNIGTGVATSINMLADLVSKLFEGELKIVYAPPRRGDISESYADTSSARRILGFQAETPLKRGLEKTLNWLVSRQ